MQARGHRVMTVSPPYNQPPYNQYKDAWDTNTPLEISIGGRTQTVHFLHTHKQGVDRVFVDHPLFLAKGERQHFTVGRRNWHVFQVRAVGGSCRRILLQHDVLLHL